MHIELKKLCIATDFSETSGHALRYAATLAAQFKAELHLLHIVQEMIPAFPEPELMVLTSEQLAANLEKQAKAQFAQLTAGEWAKTLKIVQAVRHGLPHDEICRYATGENIDLLILGTHGRTGLAHFLLGSVAERVVRCGPCPILTIRHPEHEFVVPD